MNAKIIITLICVVLLVVLWGGYRFGRSQGVTLTSLNLIMSMGADTHRSEDGKYDLPYRIFLPESTDNHKFPLIVSLQSAYGRGSNNIGQLDDVVSRLVMNQKASLDPAIVLAPQCPNGMEWNDSPPTKPPYVNIDMSKLPTSWRLQALVDLIESLSERYPVDKSRIYVVGASMGATGAWSFLYRYPYLFAGALIMNGRSDPGVAQYIQTPVHIYHGKHDTLSPIDNSNSMYKSLRELGKMAELHAVEGGHGIAKDAVTSESIMWLKGRILDAEKLARQFDQNSEFTTQ